MFGLPQLDEATIRSIDFNRTSRRILQDMCEESWGWVDPTPNDQIWARHQLTVIEEPGTLDGALLDTVRGHFEGWVKAQDKQDAWNKYRACLVMDEGAAERLGEAMTPEEHREKHGERCYTELRRWFLPAVEAFPELEEGETDFEGWMNCSVFNLIRLWTSLGDGMYMEDASNEVQDGVY
ncbi:hypothetical protein PENFLA_c040G03437 [Penicillium flavigenum]|uniref:Uncharacterized protein n=1 Tax=Penicillium flavigenum TaxID=254877 RepID=A0A1V6SK78_9EURO|nr:hypothetical protein PENFLA_c040G03437 [Penicillium flavigenum]